MVSHGLKVKEQEHTISSCHDETSGGTADDRGPCEANVDSF